MWCILLIQSSLRCVDDDEYPGKPGKTVSQIYQLRRKNLNRGMILTCHVLATMLVCSSLVSFRVERELPGEACIFVSVPFKDHSSQMCWEPKYKPSESRAYFLLGRVFMVSALLLSLCFNFVLLTFPQLLPETQKQYVSCAGVFNHHRQGEESTEEEESLGEAHRLKGGRRKVRGSNKGTILVHRSRPCPETLEDWQRLIRRPASPLSWVHRVSDMWKLYPQPII
ncbi:uncharacterized protein LOC125102018 isoform X2 [Lutra lutra]|uniref:uncharacterized protein LOC125102018 isoform X2 n=1 Tax=Lutra lutra TaxID=9657 RepID=UPI001FD4872C|nr:uncharacterized protein LOC125102018 isoform X2 [Lutra lutra]